MVGAVEDEGNRLHMAGVSLDVGSVFKFENEAIWIAAGR